jgi:dienelactone hydrolase
MLFARLTFILLVAVSFAADPASGNAARRFMVADDIGLSYFGVPNSLEDTFLFSPDGQHFVVHTERGRIDLNRPESTLRIYETHQIQQYLLHTKVTSEPLPVWEISRSSYWQGPIITHLRWLADSSGIAFLAKAETGNDQVLLAEIQSKDLLELTPKDQHVTAFDIRSRDNFVYCVLSPEVRKKLMEQSQAVSVVGTDLENLFPPEANSPGSKLYPFFDRSDLWAVANGRRFQVEDSSSDRPFSLFFKGQQVLAMSPDHRFVVTALAVDTVPSQWEKLYPPPAPSSPQRIKAGNQDLTAIDGFQYVSEYVSIDLSNGKVSRLSHGPLGSDAGWNSGPGAAWSADGQLVVLSDAFLSSGLASEDHSTAPCVAVVEIGTARSACLEHVRDAGDFVNNLQFAHGSNQRVIVEHYDPASAEHRTINYVRSMGGSWTTDTVANQTNNQTRPIELSIRQGLNDPPVLVASDNKTKAARVIWDPNPQLQSIVLAEVSVLRWKDKAGREQVGGLYKPPDYVSGRRYPLVIQTHGFSENEFSASGAFPTATAAQEMAAFGIFVLQVRGSQGCAPDVTAKEAECNVENYEAAVQKLVSDGVVDQNRVGIIGFSWTCYHVLAALTTSSLHYKAASITDGVNAGYFQYLIDAGSGMGLNHEYDSFIGAAPFGEGLQQWLKRSPGFNLDKIRTPLQVVGMGKLSALSQWEPYAALRILNKPVDFIIFSEGQHLLTNPAERMVSQGGTVDWFRFWLKGEEDPDPAKSEQYVRWRKLRELQTDAANLVSK